MKLNPISTIKANLGIDANGRVQKFFTDTCAKHMDKYIPYEPEIGALRTVVDKGTDYITYESDYASYQYHGQRQDGTHVVKNYTTPGTGPYWDERMKSAEMDLVVKETQRYVNGNR